MGGALYIKGRKSDQDYIEKYVYTMADVITQAQS